MSKNIKKVFVIGLDSAPPNLLFGKFLDNLPNIKKIVEGSIFGPMESCIPAITIPAWMVMATSKTPGELGIYGFRHRKSGTYNDIWIAHGRMIKEKAIWDYLGQKGFKSILLGVPPTYPPKKINGCMVSCFITPNASAEYTYPKELKKEIEKLVGEYIFDVPFRREARDKVKEQIWKMTRQHFEVIRYLLQEKDWNYFEFVDIGLDRIHHSFWKYFDKEHHLHEPNSKYATVIPDYYKLLDEEIGKTVKLLDEDTAIAIVSDHGIKRMNGAFAINQWMIDEGLLKIRNPEILESGKQIRFKDLDVNWPETTAWGWGGYYSRVFLNVKGREPQGKIPPSEYEKVREEVTSLLKSIRGPNGEKWETHVYYPENIYPVTRGDKPDIMVYFDDMYWRSAGTLGYPTPYLLENDTGPDDAVHALHGVFALHLPGMTQSKHVELSIYDFAPTILKLFGIKKENLRGHSII